MVIVVDSGSSKTDWRFINESGEIESSQTAGLNPHQQTAAEFKKTIEDSVIKSWTSRTVEKIYFYGAGVTGEGMHLELENRFNNYFENSKVNIASDLLGAGRALCQNRPGLVGILGTGSNSGWYDGSSITKKIPPLGYLLGDEGSGNALGRRLLADFLRNKLPTPIEKNFLKFFPNHHELIVYVYNASQPSKFLASFAPFVYIFRREDYMAKLIDCEFNNYFDILEGYDNSSDISLIGSIAFYFKDIITNVAKKRGIKLDQVIKSPIDALTLYHKSEIL